MIELLFNVVKHFDAQNPVIGSLIQEVDIRKKKGLSKFLAKAPNIRDLKVKSRLNKLREKDEFFNKGNDNNNHNSNNNNNNFFYHLLHLLLADHQHIFSLPFNHQLLVIFFLDNQTENFSQQLSHVPLPPQPLPPEPSLRLKRKSDVGTNTA